MTKAISWHDITNLIFKLKIKLFIWIHNDIMKFKFFLNYRWIQNTTTLHLKYNVEKKRIYNAQPFEATFQGLNHQASRHVMTKNDNAKEINTYFEQKNATTIIHGFLRGWND